MCSLTGSHTKPTQIRKASGAYMSQLNFATHCASTACGISLEHLLAEDAMIRSIYCFHVVFQTQKILNT